MNLRKKILVLGGGLAGVTTSIGLKKLGFDVTIIYKHRVFRAYEGLSEKTKDGLLMIGCKKAASMLKVQSKRNSNWANEKANVNYEYVVNRDEFDLALLDDAKEFEIELIEGKILGIIDFDVKPRVRYKKISEEDFEADFIVDARGRFTPFKSEYINGPKSFSLLQELKLEDTIENKTSIDSVKNGWIWQANVGENRGYIQFTCDEEFAHKIKSFEELKPYLKETQIDLWSLKDSKPIGKLVKRDSYSRIHKTIITDKIILVGDAASSIDPLSGNGAFQSMSMSSIAPYVINTILNKKENAEYAKMFYKKRVEFIFDKFSKFGKEFYSMENRFTTLFWQKRQNWPEISNKEFKNARIEKYAIVKNRFIEPKEVVSTNDNPLGVYFLDNIEIVDLVKYCMKNTKEKSLAYVEEFCKSIDTRKEQLVKNWLLKQHIL